MRQLLQNLKDGTLELAEVPCPKVRPGHLLIRSTHSLISSGSERTLLEFGRAGWISKARQQPERMRQVLEKARTDGIFATIEVVRSRLDTPLPLGYCNAGVVVEVGSGVAGFQVGDRVVSNGPHAEYVQVSKNLCARIPANVSDEEASFTVLASVGLQGIRLASPTLGETVIVFGLGLVGLMTAQMLLSNGCRIVGFDPDERRVEMARMLSVRFGPNMALFQTSSEHLNSTLHVMEFTQNRGADAVLITASTSDSALIRQAAEMCRKRGRIVLVGVVGLQLNRADFYEKELSFSVSCSYGPGRYDASYEERGTDYPLGFVRWTAQRNFEAVLDMMSAKRLDVRSLISHRVPFDDAVKAYELVLKPSQLALGTVLTYSSSCEAEASSLIHVVRHRPAPQSLEKRAVTVGVIGAGNFTRLVILPALKKTPAILKSIASNSGVSGSDLARKFGFQQSSTDYRSLLSDPEIDTIFITTPDNQHAPLVVEALDAGKNVFVEKPLAVTESQLNAVAEAWNHSLAKSPSGTPPMLHVGFNRRFAPHVLAVKERLRARSQPIAMVMTVNAGTVARGHWVAESEVPGARIVGEACHFVDLLSYLADAPISQVGSQMIGRSEISLREDVASILLHFGDGSVGTVHYLGNGHRSYPKERLEVFFEGKILVLDNFRRVSGFGWKDFQLRSWRQDKGHTAEIAAFVSRAAAKQEPLIPFEELCNVALACLAATRPGWRQITSFADHIKTNRDAGQQF